MDYKAATAHMTHVLRSLGFKGGVSVGASLLLFEAADYLVAEILDLEAGTKNPVQAIAKDDELAFYLVTRWGIVKSKSAPPKTPKTPTPVPKKTTPHKKTKTPVRKTPSPKKTTPHKKTTPRKKTPTRRTPTRRTPRAARLARKK